MEAGQEEDIPEKELEAFTLTTQLELQTEERAQILAFTLHGDASEIQTYLERYDGEVRELGKDIIVNLALQGLIENDARYGYQGLRNAFRKSYIPGAFRAIMERLFLTGVNYGKPGNSLRHPDISFREDVIKLRTLGIFFQPQSVQDLRNRFVLSMAKDALFQTGKVPKPLIILLDSNGRAEIEACKKQMESYDETIRQVLEKSGTELSSARLKRKIERGDLDVELLKRLSIINGTQTLALLMSGQVENLEELTRFPEGMEPEDVDFIDYEEQLKLFMKNNPEPRKIIDRLLCAKNGLLPDFPPERA